MEKGKSATSPEVQRLLPAAAERREDKRARKIHARAAEAAIPVFRVNGNEWRLTTAERKRILLNNIYGVDIDPQAVEVTKLSLLLKVLEGETKESITSLLRYFRERALPDLGSNIKSGNSLIGWDILDDRPDLSKEELARINPFDWKAEFPEVFEKGGFDAVIGNPPYIRIQTMKEWAPLEVERYKQKYASASKGNYDIYVIFVEKGLGLLNGKGRLGLILPHKFFNAKYGQPLRNLISDGKHLSRIVYFGDQQVFAGATTYTCLFFLDKAEQNEFEFVKVDHLNEKQNLHKEMSRIISANRVSSAEWNFSASQGGELFERLSRMPVKLKNIAARMAQGIRTSANEIYVLDIVSRNSDSVVAYSKQLDRNIELEQGIVSLFLRGREIKPYNISPSGKIVIIPYYLERKGIKLIPEEEMRSQFPKAFSYLLENKSYLEAREGSRMHGPNWYAYIYPKNIEVMKTPKILVPDIASGASFAFDSVGEYAFTSGYGITLNTDVHESQKYVLGLLNSNVLDLYLKRISTVMRGGFFRYFTQFMSQLPIRTIDFSNPVDVARHDRMVSLVQAMLDLHKQFSEAKGEHERTLLQRQIEATDRQIDVLVYELYGLTEEEIRIVEEAAK